MILMRETVNLNIEKSSLESRLAFFTNCYNMQLIHITYKCGLPTTIWQRRRYLYSIYYQIGEHLYSLQSIFNGILRGNQKGYGMLWKPFGKQDKRRPVIFANSKSSECVCKILVFNSIWGATRSLCNQYF